MLTGLIDGDAYMNTKTMTSMLALAVAAGVSVPAAAQDGAQDQVVSVYERARPDFSAPGARSGSFIFNPTIDAVGRYNSNIFARRAGATATNPGEIDDFIWAIKPGFSLTSDWNQNFFQFTADADIARYTDNSREDYEDFFLNANGRIDIERDMFFSWGVGYSDQHEDRGSPDTNGLQSEQTTFDKFTANVGFTRDQSIASIAVNADYESLSFSNPDLIGGGTLNNEDRDRERFHGSVRLGYELDQYYEAFIQLDANRIEYDNSQADGGPQRNSDGWEITGGAAFDLTGTSYGEFYVGYLKQNYDSNSLSNIDAFTYGASLLWNPSGLTSWRASVNRDVVETVVADVDSAGGLAFASGILATSFRLEMEHELQRNFLVKAAAGYSKYDYENTVREDDNYDATFGAKYLLNRNFSLNADYTWDYRSATTQGQDFKRHVFMVGLTAQW